MTKFVKKNSMVKAIEGFDEVQENGDNAVAVVEVPEDFVCPEREESGAGVARAKARLFGEDERVVFEEGGDGGSYMGF